MPITFDRPNRSAVLQQIGPELFSFDTEAAVQNGLQEWFCRQGWIACAEVPDSEDVIAGIAERRSIEHLPDRSDSRSTKCRDLMAYVQDGAYATFHIVEVKGLTQLESDFYETYGQVFPIDDPAITQGWTISKVPKHGRCLMYAHRFLTAWCDEALDTLITLVVAVPDFPPLSRNVDCFYDGPSQYYPKQAGMYAEFLSKGDIEGTHVFARLLRHLRDKYDLLGMAKATKGIAFRFWGYQGVNWVRDFATNQAVQLKGGGHGR